MDNLTVGLFGTCGTSKWRDSFISKYKELGIPYYNPQVPDGTWEPYMAKEEAHHFANDKIVLFPITHETYAGGSLAEVGFSLLNAIRLDDRRYFVILVADYLDDALQVNLTAYKESLRARSLVIEHLKKLNFSNIYVVDSLEKMLEVSILLYDSEKIKSAISLK